MIQYEDKGPGAHCPTGLSLKPVTAMVGLIKKLCLADSHPRGGYIKLQFVRSQRICHQCREYTALLGGGPTPPP